jgi:serine/threonine protein kinase/tetratricopeptide (TPR) repeat protein
MLRERLGEETIFQAARRIESSAARDDYLQSVCGGDARLLERVTALLQAHEGRPSFLESPAMGIDAGAAAVEEGPGTAIGQYKLLEQIGEGGFGVVYLAEQERPVRRKVALKIIKPGMDTRQVVARFEAERQALAMMDHPNIAKVHDAGATENGRPYFVMELVKGVPITEYCDQCNLPTRERLELFASVCQAVQHAHQKGVIHRDIKPSNVLVAMQDGKPAAKIIDFGVAKAINQQLTEHTLTTGFAQMLGTPLYMSPEQAELRPLGVDTRTDVYSLGVLLYELLTGTTPFEPARLKEASFDELRRIVREEEPPRPSTRISTLAADALSTVSEHRRTDQRRLTQLVRGDLDWIVMMCLEKDRTRRYATVSELAADVERHLTNEPVMASPPSALYLLGKFAKRNKAALTIAGLLLIVLVTVVGSVGRIVRDHMVRQAFDAASDLNSRGVKLLEQGKLDEAADCFQKAIESELFPAAHHNLGKVLWRQRKWDEAIAAFSKASEISPTYSPSEVDVGRVYGQLGRWNEARRAFARAVELDPDDHHLWYEYTCLLLYTDDIAPFRRAAQQMLDRFGDTHDLAVGDRVAKTCLLIPDAVSDLEQVLKLADRGSKAETHPNYDCLALTKGLAEYRTEKLESALKWLRHESIVSIRGWPNATASSLSAMAYHRLDRKAEATGALENARALIADAMHTPGDPRCYSHDWLRAQIVFREAERMLNTIDSQDSPLTGN